MVNIMMESGAPHRRHGGLNILLLIASICLTTYDPRVGFSMIRFARAKNYTYPQDVEALKSLHDAWLGNPSSWDLNLDPCFDEWRGIICDSSSVARITYMILPNQGLDGTLSPALGNLSALKFLDLSSNLRLGGNLPREIGNLKQIERFYINSCNFSGSIPEEIGNMTTVKFLGLSNNSFTGTLPNSVGNLSAIIWFDISYNSISGELPISTFDNATGLSTVGLDNLTNARHIHVQSNKFSGTIPPQLFNSNMQLQHLLLAENELEGPIPPNIQDLAHLDIIRLDKNMLNGSIPSSLNNITNLTTLQLGNNKLSGQIPDLSQCMNLRILSLGDNEFEPSEVPTWIMNLQNLSTLSLESSNLYGAVPRDLFGSSPTLTEVDLAFNRLNGTVDLTSPALSGDLVTVNLMSNNITAVSKGSYNQSLWLSGNPVCTVAGTDPADCEGQSQQNDNSSSASSDTEAADNSNSCSSSGECTALGSQRNPKELGTACLCAYPVVATWSFYAMKVPGLGALSEAEASVLISGLEDEFLQMWADSSFVQGIPLDKAQLVLKPVSDAALDVFVFPPANSDAWSQSNASLIQFVLQNQDIWFPTVGPMNTFLTSPGQPPENASNGLSKAAIAGIGTGATLMALAIVGLGIYAWKLKKRAEAAEKQIKPFAAWIVGKDQAPNIPRLKGARWFSFEEIRQCTNSFSRDSEIGGGGYGKVYKGTLPDSGEVVAIKRSKASSLQGADEFKNEVELLSRVHHRNLVGLIGFCFEEGEQMLVYKFMPNGTLRDALTGKSGVRMDWNKRIELALGAAKGIAYLHDEAHPPIIHRDIKSTNILLDEELVAMVSDFGLSKPTNDGSGDAMSIDHYTVVKGTMGYLDPNYFMQHELTVRSDVYSFGVTLLEVATGRLPIDAGRYLVYDVRRKVAKGGVAEVVETLLDANLRRGSYPEKGAARLVDLALRCMHDDPSDRPFMVDVVRELEQIDLINRYGSWSKEPSLDRIDLKIPPPDDSTAQTFDHLTSTDLSSSFFYSGSGTSLMTRPLVPK